MRALYMTLNAENISCVLFFAGGFISFTSVSGFVLVVQPTPTSTVVNMSQRSSYSLDNQFLSQSLEVFNHCFKAIIITTI